jgi:putative long-chain-fatty-acid--coA ligase
MLNRHHLSVLIPEQAKKYGDRTAMTYRSYEQNRWLPISWNQFSAKVTAVSRSLLALGVERQERIAIFSQNKPESLFVAFGGYGIRAVSIPFYATSSGAQVIYMMNDAEVRYLFVGEQQQYDTAADVIHQCNNIQRIIIFDRHVRRRESDGFSIYFDEFLQLGEVGNYDKEIAQRKSEASFDDMADILYTSGTTGNSKGVILTYAMYDEAAIRNDENLPLSDKDVVLNFLPFTHVFERAWSYLCLGEGAQLAINLRPTDVQQSMQEVHPTCMAAVPRFWEKVYQAVQEKIAKASLVERKLMQNALDTGMKYWADYASKGKTAPLGLSLKYKLYDRTIYKLVRKTLGLENSNFFPTAGAAVSPEVEKFAHAVGIYMLVGYGLTESTATVSNDHKGERMTIGSVGQPIKGLEIKFGENDEILLRGRTITPGYYRKDNTTRAAIDEDGWFHTGDAGYMKDGELYLKERIKDLFKTSNGKYIAPQMIESKMAIDRYIEQCVIVADKRKFVSALIVPNYKLLEEFAIKEGLIYNSRAELCQNAKVMKFIADRIDTLQQDLAHYEQIKHFVLMPEPFTVEGGELTNTLKVKRNVVYQRYAEKIEEIYRKAELQYAH